MDRLKNIERDLIVLGRKEADNDNTETKVRGTDYETWEEVEKPGPKKRDKGKKKV